MDSFAARKLVAFQALVTGLSVHCYSRMLALVDAVELPPMLKRPAAQRQMELMVDYGCEEVRQMRQVAATVAVVHMGVGGLAGRQAVADIHAQDSPGRLRSKEDQNF